MGCFRVLDGQRELVGVHRHLEPHVTGPGPLDHDTPSGLGLRFEPSQWCEAHGLAHDGPGGGTRRRDILELVVEHTSDADVGVGGRPFVDDGDQIRGGRTDLYRIFQVDHLQPRSRDTAD